MSTENKTDSIEWKELIKKELIRSRVDVNRDLLEKAKSVITLSDEGRIHFLIKLSTLSPPDKIVLYLIGKWFAHQAELTNSDGATYTELVTELSLPLGTVKSSIYRLNSERIIEKVDRAKYRISYTEIEPILDDLLKRVKT